LPSHPLSKEGRTENFLRLEVSRLEVVRLEVVRLEDLKKVLCPILFYLRGEKAMEPKRLFSV
jgi:hypothetical protein